MTITLVAGITHSEAEKILAQHSKLNQVEVSEIKGTIEMFNSLAISNKDILSKPNVLQYVAWRVETRMQVLRECGFTNISVIHFNAFVSILNRNIKRLKFEEYLSSDLDVVEHILQQIKDVQLNVNRNCPKLGEIERLSDIRKIIIKKYLAAKLGLSEGQIKSAFLKYPTLKWRSLQSLRELIDILENDLAFDRKKSVSNLGLLRYADPRNIRQLINNMPVIAGSSIRDVICQCPHIILFDVERIEKILKILSEFDISDAQIQACVEIFTINPHTVYDRLCRIQHFSELSLLKMNPNYLQLIFKYSAAVDRLKIMNTLDATQFTVSVLTGSERHFVKFGEADTFKKCLID